MAKTFTISEVAARAGVETSALRYYERRGLIHSERNSSGYRTYHPEVLRRLAFITVGQQVGIPLSMIGATLEHLPGNRVPNEEDWGRLGNLWRELLDDKITMLTALRDKLDRCIGCGCLSLKDCALSNRSDQAASLGPGPQLLRPTS